MSTSLKFLLIITAVIIFVVVITALKKGRIPLKYSLVWFIPTGLLLFISLMPSTMWKFTEMIGFQTVSNFVVGIMFVMLFFVCISLTIIVSGQKTKIQLLIQEVSMLKNEFEKKDKVSED